MDFNFNYERKNWGLLVFKAQDLRDHNSSNNFALAMFYKTLPVGKRFIITPYFGAVLDQSRSIADKGSDVIGILTTAFKVHPHFTIDNSIIFSDLMLERRSLDWVNRLRFLYVKNHLDLTLLLWHNNKIFDSSGYFSGGLHLAFSRLRVSSRIDLGIGLTGVVMMQSSDRQAYPKKNGLLFSMSVVLH